MADATRPFLVLYVAWHPAFSEGKEIAEALFEHFRHDHYKNITGGAGVGVFFRSMPAPDSAIPLPIDFNEAETTAVIILVDQHLTADVAWLAYVREMVNQAKVNGLRTRVFPVAIDQNGLNIGIKEQMLRWDQWHKLKSEARKQYLISRLTYEFCRMLRHYLEYLKHPTVKDDDLTAYLQKVQIFLSHTKRDKDKAGEKIARRIRDHLHKNHSLASFFDVNDIPGGLPFDEVLLHQVRVSAVIAIHTDSYSSREWCRKEIIEAKRWSVPLVVANCISNLDERNFPYMGNVPIVRMTPKPIQSDRIEFIIGRLLDEVLKSFLWLCRVEIAGGRPEIAFLPRQPELISLAGLDMSPSTGNILVVYPDPPLGGCPRILTKR